jgi:hypothetical protein
MVAPPLAAPAVPPFDGTVLPPFGVTVVPPFDGTVVPPFDGTVVPPFAVTVVPPFDGTVVPPFAVTVVPPVEAVLVAPPELGRSAIELPLLQPRREIATMNVSFFMVSSYLHLLAGRHPIKD